MFPACSFSLFGWTTILRAAQWQVMFPATMITSRWKISTQMTSLQTTKTTSFLSKNYFPSFGFGNKSPVIRWMRTTAESAPHFFCLTAIFHDLRATWEVSCFDSFHKLLFFLWLCLHWSQSTSLTKFATRPQKTLSKYKGPICQPCHNSELNAILAGSAPWSLVRRMFRTNQYLNANPS